MDLGFYPGLSPDFFFHPLLPNLFEIPAETPAEIPSLEPLEETQKKVICPICAKQFLKTTIKNHVNLHKVKTGEKKFTCEICSKKFYMKHHLKQHVNGHTKPFTCDLCGKKLARLGSLNKHFINIHSTNLNS
jgi:uncharacterized Zn-finger protein